MGAGIAARFAEKGAYVTIADINEKLGKSYSEELQAEGLHVQFIATDVTSWTSQVAAFKAAIAFSPSHSAIDIVVAAAGVFGIPFLEPDEPPVSLESDPPAPNMVALEVNTIGAYYTAKLAERYFALPPSSTSTLCPDPKSLIFIASVAAYFDIPIMSSYSASKYAMRGLFRSIRPIFAQRGFRVNLLAPWIMDTPLAVDWIKMFKAVGAPVGDVEDVYTAAMRLADDPTVNGRAFAIGSKRILDLGDDLEGEDAGKAMHGFYETEIPGWSKLEKEMLRYLGF